MPQLFNMNVRLDMNTEKVLKRLNLEEGGKVQQVIDSEVVRLCNPYVPKENGILMRSGKDNTVIGSGEVVYQTPYARKQYYIPMKHTEGRTHMWFEQMKRSGGKEKILNAARKAVGGN